MLPQCLHPDGMQSVCQSVQGLPVRLELSARLRWSQIDESCFIPIRVWPPGSFNICVGNSMWYKVPWTTGRLVSIATFHSHP